MSLSWGRRWVRVKIQPPGDRRFWSMFPRTRVLFGVPVFEPQLGEVFCSRGFPTEKPPILGTGGHRLQCHALPQSDLPQDLSLGEQFAWGTENVVCVRVCFFQRTSSSLVLKGNQEETHHLFGGEIHPDTSSYRLMFGACPMRGLLTTF